MQAVIGNDTAYKVMLQKCIMLPAYLALRTAHFDSLNSNMYNDIAN